jgi:hypothetical protein
VLLASGGRLTDPGGARILDPRTAAIGPVGEVQR